jgi:hypothetical protein
LLISLFAVAAPSRRRQRIILTSPVAGESPSIAPAGSLCPAPLDPLPERLKNDLLLPAKIRFVSLLAPARSGT